MTLRGWAWRKRAKKSNKMETSTRMPLPPITSFPIIKSIKEGGNFPPSFFLALIPITPRDNRPSPRPSSHLPCWQRLYNPGVQAYQSQRRIARQTCSRYQRFREKRIRGYRYCCGCCLNAAGRKWRYLFMDGLYCG